MNKVLYIITAVIAVAVGLVVFLKSTTGAQPEHALYYQQARDIKPFEMTDHQGKTFSNNQLMGKWSWVFFGYTSCPDVCPTTLQELNFVYSNFKTLADNTQVILVTVDPKRDTQEKLAQYIAYFNEEFFALRAGHEVLFPFARNLGLMYAITGDDENAPDNYLVDHSASIVLINPQGKISAIFKPQHQLGEVPSIDRELLLSDFQKIVNLN